MINENDNDEENEETVAQTGYVIAGGTELDSHALAWLVRTSFYRNLVPYDAFVEWAQENGMERDEVPDMRSLTTAFSEAKNLLTGRHDELPVLESLEGWDSRVSQELKVDVLQKGNHYFVTLRRRGYRNGQMDLEDLKLIRLRRIVPDGFDANVWRNNYMESAWNDNVQRQPMSAIDTIIDMTPYSDDIPVDPVLFNRIRTIILNRLRLAAVSVDEDRLKDKVYRAIKTRMHGVRKDRKTDYLVPRNGRDGEDNGPVLARYQAMVEFFGSFNPTQHDWYTDSGSLSRQAVGTFFERLQYLDGEEERNRASASFVADLTDRYATYLDKVVRASEDFNEDDTDKAIARQTQLVRDKAELEEYHARVERDFGMTIDIPDSAHTPIRTRVASRINEMSDSAETVANQYQSLLRVRPRRARR